MAKYRKKPVVIDAVKFDGTDESVEWLLPQLKSGEIGRSTGKLHIKTLEGIMQANVGDYVIKGINDEFYPCKPDIFEKTYEEVKPVSETEHIKQICKPIVSYIEEYAHPHTQIIITDKQIRVVEDKLGIPIKC
ncbi:MAG: hypothetical protein RR657_01585 [Peptostreptococcaceae bacterium]